MCGILAMFGGDGVVDLATFGKALHAIRHRGPDAMRMQQSQGVTLGFQRLAIVDRHASAIQPMTLPTWPTVTLLYNGEVYNHAHMTEDHRTDTRCDGEALVWAYARGVEKVCEQARGVFAGVIIDWKRRRVVVFRDAFGVRPLFRLQAGDVVAYGSEVGSLCRLDPDGALGSAITEFPPGTWVTHDLRPDGSLTPVTSSATYCDVGAAVAPSVSVTAAETLVQRTVEAAARIAATEATLPQGDTGAVLPESWYRDVVPPELWHVREALAAEVRTRCDVADVPVGALLSGGLDSSLVVALASAHLREAGTRTFKAFSIGMPGSTDVPAAVDVARFLGVDHVVVEVTEAECVAALPHVVRSTATWDPTTIRASTPMWFAARHIAASSDVTVVLSGEGADEVCQGYVYFKAAPSTAAADAESRRLCRQLHQFDVLRADRTVSAHGLELRVPFLGVDFVRAFMALPPEVRQPLTPLGADPSVVAGRVEKLALRVACAGVLPWRQLLRPKEAFSDGISSLSRPWFAVVQETAAACVSDAELAAAATDFPHAPPATKEALHFRRMFRDAVGRDDLDGLIAHAWVPQWCGGTTEASARALSHLFVAEATPASSPEDGDTK